LCREFKTKYEVTAETLLIKLATHQSSSSLFTVQRLSDSLHVTVQKQQAVHTAGGNFIKYVIPIPIPISRQ